MLARLFRQSGTYALAGVVGKLSGVVLTAFYIDTAYLSVEGYGYFGVLRAAMMTGLLIAGAGIPLGVIRFSTSDEVTDADRAAVPSTALLIAAAAGALTAAALWAAAPTVAGLLAGELRPLPAYAPAVRLLAAYVLLRTVADVAFAELRHREKVGWFVAFSAAETLALLGGVLWFLVVQREGLLGVMKGYVLSAAAVALIGTVGLLRDVAWRPSRALVRPMLVFGAPLILSGLAAKFLYFGDRFLIAHFAGLEANATYELAAQFGTLVYTFLVQGFQLSFTVLGMKAFGRPGTGALYRRTLRHFSALAGGAVLGVGLFASAAARLFADDPAYVAIDAPAALVAGGFACQGLYAIAVSALYGAGRTRTVAAGVGSAAVLNVALNVALIPALGVVGAALATLGAYAALAVWTGRVAEGLVEARLPWSAVARVALATAGLWALGALASNADLGGLALRVGVVALYPLALAALGVYGRADLEAGRAFLRARRRG